MNGHLSCHSILFYTQWHNVSFCTLCTLSLLELEMWWVCEFVVWMGPATLLSRRALPVHTQQRWWGACLPTSSPTLSIIMKILTSPQMKGDWMHILILMYICVIISGVEPLFGCVLVTYISSGLLITVWSSRVNFISWRICIGLPFASLKVVSRNWDISMGLCVGLQTAPIYRGQRETRERGSHSDQ